MAIRRPAIRVLSYSNIALKGERPEVRVGPLYLRVSGGLARICQKFAHIQIYVIEPVTFKVRKLYT